MGYSRTYQQVGYCVGSLAGKFIDSLISKLIEDEKYIVHLAVAMLFRGSILSIYSTALGTRALDFEHRCWHDTDGDGSVICVLLRTNVCSTDGGRAH